MRVLSFFILILILLNAFKNLSKIDEIYNIIEYQSKFQTNINLSKTYSQIILYNDTTSNGNEEDFLKRL